MDRVKFYDTNALLKLKEKVLEDEYFYISSVTLRELEHIKVSKNKTEQVKYDARKVIHILDENEEKYRTIFVTDEIIQYVENCGLEQTPDNQICACAAYTNSNINDDIVFVTNDICCKVTAKDYFELYVESVEGSSDNAYTGYLEVVLSDDKMAYFYEHLNENTFDLLPNQYLIIKNADGEVVDSYRWNGESYEMLFKEKIRSIYFDNLKVKDIYQQCAVDSLMNCTITAITGKAGSGKSLLSLMSAMYLIEKGRYDRIVVMFNPTKTRGASDMGYYSGDFTDKAMQNSIGQILTTKFGDRYAVDLLISQNKLKLVSMADCRGMEISDNEILWITEGQNTSIELIKLCLSRVSSGAKVYIEGDYTNQVDAEAFSGSNNGLKRLIDVFKGHEEFGFIQLQNVWRSKIAELCELL